MSFDNYVRAQLCPESQVAVSLAFLSRRGGAPVAAFELQHLKIRFHARSSGLMVLIQFVRRAANCVCKLFGIAWKMP